MIEIREHLFPVSSIVDLSVRELHLSTPRGKAGVVIVLREIADEIDRLQRDSEALAVAVDALREIAAYPPPVVEATDGHTMKVMANHALSRIRDLQGAEKEG